MDIGYCPCDLCNGRLTGAWEDEEDWLSKAYADEEEYYKEYYRQQKIEDDLLWEYYLQVCREDNVCPNCGESPWDTEDGPCNKCLRSRETGSIFADP